MNYTPPQAYVRPPASKSLAAIAASQTQRNVVSLFHPEKKIQPKVPRLLEGPPPVKKQNVDSVESVEIPDVTEPAKYDPSSRGVVKVKPDWVHTPGSRGNPGVEVHSKLRDVLQSHFFYYVVGKPGSGKTFIIEELVLNPKFYSRKFDKVLIVSPYELPTLPCIKGKNYFPTFDPEALLESIALIANAKPSANVLIIIDDFISIIGKTQTREAFLHLVYNRRKLIPKGTISFMVTGQKYIILPPTIRAILTGIIVFPVQGNDWNTICRENVFVENSKLVKEIILAHWKQDSHNFVFINLEKGKTFLNLSLEL